ncbi:MAG: sterol desaturase family protein [Pseudomonadota bacterium]
MLETLYLYIVEYLRLLTEIPFNSVERFYFVYLLTFVGFAYLAYRRYYRTRRSFLAWLFPKAIYLHRSARTDYAIYLINLFIAPLTGFFGVALNSYATLMIAQALVGLNGGSALIEGPWNDAVSLAFILGFTLAADLAVYVVHRLHHQSDILWPLHALHHSAEVMTPVTLFRKHPLWNVSANLLSALFTGIFQGMFVFLFYGTPDYAILLGINTIYAVFNFFASNLRHSHVWLSWGRPLSYLFISPAMHQIHHDPQRMRKNYGEVFAIWDWMFGTLYIPDEREKFAIGLPEGNPHRTVARAYWVPVVEFVKALGRKLRLPG